MPFNSTSNMTFKNTAINQRKGIYIRQNQLHIYIIQEVCQAYQIKCSGNKTHSGISSNVYTVITNQ